MQLLGLSDMRFPIAIVFANNAECKEIVTVWSELCTPFLALCSVVKPSDLLTFVPGACGAGPSLARVILKFVAINGRGYVQSLGPSPEGVWAKPGWISRCLRPFKLSLRSGQETRTARDALSRTPGP